MKQDSGSIFLVDVPNTKNDKLAAVFTLVKIGLGAGIVTLPKVFQTTGLALGVPMLAILSSWAYLGVTFVVEAKLLTGEKTLQNIG